MDVALLNGLLVLSHPDVGRCVALSPPTHTEITQICETMNDRGYQLTHYRVNPDQRIDLFTGYNGLGEGYNIPRFSSQHLVLRGLRRLQDIATPTTGIREVPRIRVTFGGRSRGGYGPIGHSVGIGTQENVQVRQGPSTGNGFGRRANEPFRPFALPAPDPSSESSSSSVDE